ncbi:unnamed protein product [Ectocarpus sp. CCAP 1310/34]|nr:unnamed protein product [Ectocarpus sp. CCAP 1310/34]
MKCVSISMCEVLGRSAFWPSQRERDVEIFVSLRFEVVVGVSFYAAVAPHAAQLQVL